MMTYIEKTKIETLNKFLRLHAIAKERNRMLAIDEIVQAIHCCRGHAYNYHRALCQILPPAPFDPDRPVVREDQVCLRT